MFTRTFSNKVSAAVNYGNSEGLESFIIVERKVVYAENMQILVNVTNIRFTRNYTDVCRKTFSRPSPPFEHVATVGDQYLNAYRCAVI